LKEIDSQLNGILLLKPAVFEDQRGFFFECFHNEKFTKLGIEHCFIQDNLSKSSRGTIRGLHFQTPPFEQGKLCQVILGKVLDVVVDIRKGSPTYGKYYSTELSDENHNIIWIPPGFSHGFSVLSDTAVFHYKCTGFYNKLAERTLLYNDPTIGIDWKTDTPIVSDKDIQGVPLSMLDNPFSYKI
jgi:dTDP-4-dehydrorhamnose 3,5-epimerase